MKIIFIKDVKGQGKSGEIKEVKAGYAQNFLIKNGYAVTLTDKSMSRLNEDIQNKKEKEEESIKEFEKIKEALEKEKLVFKVKTGDKDKVFGSISSKQINTKLEELGYKIDRKKIVLFNPIATLGIHNIKVPLHKKVAVNLTIELIKE